MRLSRREFLAAATTMVAAGCSVRPGNDSGSQIIPAEEVPGKAQVLDPDLVLSLPARAVAPETVARFAKRNRVKVQVQRQTTEDNLLLTLSAGGEGQIDVALVDQQALTYLIDERLVEPVDHSLIPNLRLISSPFDDPPYDSGSGYSVAKDYSVVGYATVFDQDSATDSWVAFFDLAKANRHRVAVPDDSDNVVGAAMLALGHSWSSSTLADMAEARAFLLGLRKSLLVQGSIDRSRIGNLFAVMASSLGFRDPASGIRFVVPKEGAVINMRSYCIPTLAPGPVTAHTWLNATLAPTSVSADVDFSRRASPVAEANYVVDPAILANPAIYPPVQVADKLQFSTLTPAQSQARAALWAEVKP